MVNSPGFLETYQLGYERFRAGTAIPDAKLAALAGFTRHLLQARGRPTAEAARAFLAAGFTERQILEVILAIAVKTLSNYSNHIFGTPVDHMFKSRLWAPPAV